MIACTTADRDLTSQVEVLAYTNSTGDNLLVQVMVFLGDGSKDLDGSGGNFELTMEVGGQTFQPDPQLIVFSTAARAAVVTEQFPLYDTEAISAKIKSPNAADTDVTIKACIIEAGSSTGRSDADDTLEDLRRVKNVYGQDQPTTRGLFPEPL